MIMRLVGPCVLSLLLTLSASLPASASVADGAAPRRVDGTFTVSIDPNSVRPQPIGQACQISLTASSRSQVT